MGTLILLSILLIGTMLLVPQLLTTDSIKQKIQIAVTKQTGGEFDYRKIGLSFFPRLVIEMRQVTLTIPNQQQASLAALRISPDFFPLLTGNLRLGLVELKEPQFSLEMPDTGQEFFSTQPYPLAALKKSFGTTLEPFGTLLAGLNFQIDNGQLTVTGGRIKLVEIKGLSLQCEMSVSSPHSIQAELEVMLSELSIYRNKTVTTLKDMRLENSLKISPDNVSFTLHRLILSEPELELSGDLTLATTTPTLTLNLTGRNLDVEAIRRTALPLAGDTSPAKEIFDHLRGGRVPRLSVTAHGENPSALSDLGNISIKGQLQEGRVSIPEIEMDLTEVSGDVVISKGVLHATRLSTRLGKSIGMDGSLNLGLVKDDDLFQLDLPLNVDLAEIQPILQRAVTAPTLIAELDKISNLKGTGRGRLIVGDSLHNINTGIKAGELSLSANYQGVPLPIAITGGHFSFDQEQINITKLSGTLGQSIFSDVSGQLLSRKNLMLAISSGQFDLNMAELYPWLASLGNFADQLQKVRQVTGRLNLSTVEIQGDFSKPSEWKFATTGIVQNLVIETAFFPNKIAFTSGNFTFDPQHLNFDKLQTTAQDAALILSGSFQGTPRQLNRIDLLLDGKMGPQSVKWLSDRAGLPKDYAVHAPLRFTHLKISWLPDSTASFNGAIALDQGPILTAEITYKAEQLQVHKLTIKDRYSNADMAFEGNNAHYDFKFAGSLQHETLQALFIKNPFSRGRIEGDFAFNIPRSEQSQFMTRGQLIAQNLPILLPSGDKVVLEKMTLRAGGPQVDVDITQLTWKGLTWEPVKATFAFDHHGGDLRITQANLCGIDSSGAFSLQNGTATLDMTLEGKDLDVATSYTCLTDGRVKMTGTLDFYSQINAQSPRHKWDKLDELFKSLHGPLNMTFRNGLIRQHKLLARTLEVLNVTEIVKGRLPNLSSSALPYATMTMDGEFTNGTLLIEKYFMDGETLNLIGTGEIRLEEETIDMQLLAAPFKTVDTVVKNIPGINYLLAGSLVTIPVSITGSFTAPNVQIMTISAVSSGLFKLAERTIKSPLKLIQTIIPWSKQKAK